MIELAKHIESLLLKQDCVIIPGFGGLITQYVPAQWIEEENLFIPPYRNIGFNRQLTLNDGSLVQSYMRAYDASYPEALRMINDAVSQLRICLDKEEQYELSGIGTLVSDVTGSYSFIPCESGVISPELYGLDALSVSLASKDQTEGTIVSNKKNVHLKRTKRNYTFTINREIVNYVATAVVAVCFYFLWAVPINNTSNNQPQEAKVVYEQLFAPVSNKPLQNQITKVSDCVAQNKTSLTENSNSIDQSTETEVDKKDTTPSECYTIVLASAISKKGAEALTAELKKQGMTDVEPYKRGKMLRVVYGAYSSKTEAQVALNKLHDNEAFAQAWIMQK